ncbi:aspergillopepsin-2 precursor [Diaporthe helianthi]|uniref:Aspergillopepsin-2 n=1 Tax=Diaporthe helianthi TaxID=158607 RepID=A0A2P5I642_DIAHE|nr:aspergillopepsin-2 precursor [Diaporthe helianthi]
MKYSAAIFALAGTALAARRATHDLVHPQHMSIPNRRANSGREYSANWSGATQTGEGFNKVNGTIVLPKATGGGDAGASAWVGIDGSSCTTAILQTGIDFNGDGSYRAWYEWLPDVSHDFDGFDLLAGDEIYMEVNACSKTTGLATLENLTTGQKATHSFERPSDPLCQTNAAWIVEDFYAGDTRVPMANFGKVTFANAFAQNSAGTVTPGGGTIINIRDSDGKVFTDCNTSGDNLTCTYIG